MLSATVIISALLMSAIIVVLPAVADARTIVVPDDYSTVQEAVYAASAGDTVFVRKGIYNETTLKISRPLSLIGEDAVTTWINLNPPWIEYEYNDFDPFGWRPSSGYDNAIEVETDDVKISGFTINKTNTDIGGSYRVIGSRIQIVENIVLDGDFHFIGSYNVFALNTVKARISFYGEVIGYNTIAGNMVMGGSIWIYPFCSANVIYGNTLVDDARGIGIAGNENIVVNNTIKNSEYGLVVNGAEHASNNTFYANTVINNTVGLAVQTEGSNNTFYANYVANNRYGVEAKYYFPVGDNNTFYRNSFVDNVEQIDTNPNLEASDGEPWTAHHGGRFDDGNEGNYWSDYDGGDANVDGIGDSPYVIDENRQDNYPLMTPFDISSIIIELPEWAYALPYPLPSPLPLPPSENMYSGNPNADGTPPEITVLSPTSQAYNESNISIVFTLNKPCNWTGYSLNGEENMTVIGNFTLTDLPNGSHNFTVYANDTYGNMGVSQPINFTIAVPQPTPEPFPVVPVAIASVATVAVVGVGLVVYFKKRKKGKGS
jgi:nitrous oxidase accessory protein